MDVNWLQACLLADVAGDVGDPAAAAYLHERLEPYADLFAVIARGAGCYCSTELYLGRAAAALGRFDEAEARLRRAVARGLSEESARARLLAQGDGEERRRAAHRRIDNCNDLQHLRRQVDDLITELRRLAAG